MLKPIDKGVEISNIRLVSKKGGKSDFKNELSFELQAAVIVCSDTISKGTKEDKAGKAIIQKLNEINIDDISYSIIPDDKELIASTVLALATNHFDLIIVTGGTGLSDRDVSPEAIRPLLDREIPGIMEAARNYGQSRTPYAMLSRGIAGMIGDTVVLTLPGSTRGAEESMDAIFPHILHIFAVMQGKPHPTQS